MRHLQHKKEKKEPGLWEIIGFLLILYGMLANNISMTLVGLLMWGVRLR